MNSDTCLQIGTHSNYQKMKSESCSVLSDSFVTPWTIQFMEFSRLGYWSGQPLPSPGRSSQPRDQTQVSCIAGGFFTTEPPGKPLSKDRMFLSTTPPTPKLLCAPLQSISSIIQGPAATQSAYYIFSLFQNFT